MIMQFFILRESYGEVVVYGFFVACVDDRTGQIALG